MTDRYKRFVPHEDHVQEIISADHINEIQDQVQDNQEEAFRQEDVDFLDRALFILDNHPIVNSLYVDLLDDPNKVDIPNSPGLAFNVEERSISFDTSGAIQATLVGKLYTNPNNTNIKQIILLANTDCPGATRINIELSNNGLDFYPVVPSESNVFEFPTTGTKLQVKMTFIRSYDEPSPILKSYGILFRDAKYVVTLLDESPFDPGTVTTMGISHNDLLNIGPDDHHPKEHTHDGTDGSGVIKHESLADIGPDDHHPKAHTHGKDDVDYVHLETDVAGTLGLEHFPYVFWTGKPGDLTLVRNPAAHDKLVEVISPDDETYLFYDWTHDGRLEKTITIMGDIAVEENLNYSSYTDEFGVTSDVVTGTTKYIKDASDAMIQESIASVMAPAPVKEA